jgi:hypothetical protein
VVARHGLSSMAAGIRSWSWTGRDSSRQLVYRLTISARDEVGHRDEATSAIKVVTEVVAAKNSNGLESRLAARSAAQGCTATTRGDDTMELDCWPPPTRPHSRSLDSRQSGHGQTSALRTLRVERHIIRR